MPLGGRCQAQTLTGCVLWMGARAWPLDCSAPVAAQLLSQRLELSTLGGPHLRHPASGAGEDALFLPNCASASGWMEGPRARVALSTVTAVLTNTCWYPGHWEFGQP